MDWFKRKRFFGIYRKKINELISEFLRQQGRETNSYPSIDDDDGIMLGGSFYPYATTTDEDRAAGFFTFVFRMGPEGAMTEHRARLVLSDDLQSISYLGRAFPSDNEGLSELVALIISDTSK